MIGLIAVMILAAWARFDGLGEFGFWTDELYHVVAAQSILEGSGPVIPGRGEYRRAFIATSMTVVGFTLFGESEWSARFPFALVSLLFLVVAYMTIAARFSRLLSLITVLLLALTPQFLQVGRECRMYAPFVLLYFIGVFMAHKALEPPLGGDRRSPVSVILALGLAGVAFLSAMSLQFLAFNFGFTLTLYCLAMIAYLAARQGLGPAARSRYALLFGLMCLAGLVGWLLLPDLSAKLIDLARTPMAWDTRGHPAPFCLWFFNYYYPAFWFIYPIGAVILIHKYGRLGVFIVCAFVPVLLAHMFLFTSRIAERYLLYILPFFFLVSAGVIESLVWALAEWIRGLRSNGTKGLVVAAVICTIPAAWLFLHPWLSSSRELRQYGLGPDWKMIGGELQSAFENGVVITTWPREVMYYGGRFPDFIITQTYELDSDGDHIVTIGERELSVNYLTDAPALSNLLASGQDVYFVTTDWAYGNDAYLNDEMREVLQRELKELVSISSGNDRAVIYSTHHASQ